MRTRAIPCALAIAVSASAAHAEVGPNVVACTHIKTVTQLQAINTNATTRKGTYCLDTDVDMTGVTWTPIGNASSLPNSAFNGQFYGNGHVIRNLTVTGSADGGYGLFGVVSGGVIRDLSLINVNLNTTAVNSYAGGLIGVIVALTSPVFISGVSSTGSVTGAGSAGGLIGALESNVTLTDSWSSADVAATSMAGGLLGETIGTGNIFQRLYATGNVSGMAIAGGLFGAYQGASYTVGAYATGKVTGGANGVVGGLIGTVSDDESFLQDAYATGPVSGGASATVGGLIGELLDNGSVGQVFSVGAVAGGSTRGGLIGVVPATPTIKNAYWDSDTSGQATSAAGVAKTTAQLQGALPAGFTLGWGINKTKSYPYLSDPDNFTSTLATLAPSNAVFAFLPISQLDASQYFNTPAHADQASLATVYTMIARAVGITDNVSTLLDVYTDKYFWIDSTQTTKFTGPITSHATLGKMTTIAAGAHLNGTNVIGQMNAHRLVILRGTYRKAGGGTATHYMLGTLYTKAGNAVHTVVADDPWTGMQVEISPATKRVVTPGFPLANFTVDGYRPVTTLN